MSPDAQGVDRTRHQLRGSRQRGGNCAPLDTHERFIGFLIEHYAGNFPLWLAPDQVRVITLNDDEALINYAKPIVAELRANMVRVDADYSATPFKAKISNAEQE